MPRNWEPVLDESGYRFAHFDGLNCYYVSNEHADRLLPLLATEVNIFDDFIAVHDLKKAQSVADGGFPVPGLLSVEALQEAERRAADEANKVLVLEKRIAETEAQHRDAELQVLEREFEVQFLRAESLHPQMSVAKSVDPIDDSISLVAPASVDAPVIFIDATLLLHHDLISAVGIVRVEQYVAEFLLKDPAVSVKFVTFERTNVSYRAVTEQERGRLELILFRRYTVSATNCSTDALPDAVEADD